MNNKSQKDNIISIIKASFSDSFYLHFRRILSPKMKPKDFNHCAKIIKKDTQKSAYELANFLMSFNSIEVCKELRYIQNQCKWVGTEDQVLYIKDNTTNEPVYKFAHYQKTGTLFEDCSIHHKPFEVIYINGTFEFLYPSENQKLFSRPIVKYNFKVNSSWKNGKDEIKSYFFKPEMGYLYFLKLRIGDVITNKIGITKLGVVNRFKNEKVTIMEHKEIKMSMLEAATIEKALHKDLQGYRHYFDLEFGGKNECYRINVSTIECDITDAINILDIDNYLNIPNGTFKNILKYQKELINE